ncbi:hypothetical protein [Fictibacillus phosphorivorans]|uniref:hypothetical protein n=1 Tax=Fictibacillus phosphorivorans TaxID=1221500 RepID=UPI0020406B6F|nr:hypothetical protein [Fictibacillus phosphorivorans]MCM3720043.1 hypothetical protein [Fictibacillus phosphorivorans]MCM3777758.1 hypothetical protein [Fictibacillus phosphorivorans]
MEGSTKTFDETRLVSFLYDKYHLIAPLSCKLLRSSFNDHYIIQTTTKKFILRVYLNGKYYLRSSDDIQFELDLLRYLYLNGLAVIPPVVNKNNETISVITNNGENHYLALFPYAAGKPIDESLTIEQAMKLGYY